MPDAFCQGVSSVIDKNFATQTYSGCGATLCLSERNSLGGACTWVDGPYASANTACVVDQDFTRWQTNITSYPWNVDYVGSRLLLTAGPLAVFYKHMVDARARNYGLTNSASKTAIQSAISYYFSASGNDGNDCRSTSTACKTVSKVSSLTYAPGNSILFHGGDSFVGCWSLNSTRVPSLGSKDNPITINSYGGGTASLLSNCSGPFKPLLNIDGISGVKIQNLILSADGVTNSQIGIEIQNSSSRNAVDTVIINNVEVTGFNATTSSNYAVGIFIAGRANNGRCGPLNNIQVLNSTLHGALPTSTDDNGINGYGCGNNVTNVIYRGNLLYNIGGHPNGTNGTSGNGLLANGVNGGELSFNIAHDNGANTNTCGGPAGVWAYSSANITIQYNEVYNMQPSSFTKGCDWAAYDLDAGVSNSVLQYNYSHNNFGPGLLLFVANHATAWGPNTVRYNVSENDNHTGGGNIGVAKFAKGTAYIYNNTIWSNNTLPAGTRPWCLQTAISGSAFSGIFANNICAMNKTDLANAQFVYLETGSDGLTFKSNAYYANNGGVPTGACRNG